MNAAAVILCAGNGTRMNDDSKNKVCFDCAGVPTIKRIIANMRSAGVGCFVIVIGHQAYSVMDCLYGEEGIVYAYQKERKGTGHAALCGMNALKAAGYTGPVIVSMGDKIIDTEVIRGLLDRTSDAEAVWGVQPLKHNFNGGRVVMKDGSPVGIVEFADAALMALADEKPESYAATLKSIGLNEKKADKVIKMAIAHKPVSHTELCGYSFTAKEVLNSPYANAGLYCFDLDAALEIISAIGSNNAQGEIYITDALEQFAKRGTVLTYEVARPEQMLTYSTKPELRDISRHFMRTAKDIIEDIDTGKLDSFMSDLYADEAEQQKLRYKALLELFIEKYGNKRVVITRSPGRVNMMGRHIDHRGGGINVMAIDRDTVLVASPRDNDDTVNIANISTDYPSSSFSIGALMGEKRYEKWLDYLADERVVKELAQSRGDWSNYVKSAIARVCFEYGATLSGMDIVAGGTIPEAAGLSSSSSIVVATMEAINALNSFNISDKDFISLCGEGEWFVGSRGGAGDHAAMKCSRKGRVTHLGFKPFYVGDSAAFSDKYAVVVANSMIRAKKSEGSKDKFNAQVASYELALALIKQNYPDQKLGEFRDLAAIRPYSKIYKMLKSLPDKITRGELMEKLSGCSELLERVFRNHADPGEYKLRDVALYGISECARSEQFMQILDKGDYASLGEMMKISHNGDRCGYCEVTDSLLDSLIESDAEPALQCGAYDCSTKQIDGLCDLLNATDGVLGSEIVGAGLGGCVIALIEKEKADRIISIINEKYYDKYGYEHAVHVCFASSGSCIVF